MLEDRLFVAGRELAVSVDRWRVFDQALVVADLDVAGTDGRLVQGHENKTMPGRYAHSDRAERRQVGARVDVDGLQSADLAAIGVDYVVATPLTYRQLRTRWRCSSVATLPPDATSLMRAESCPALPALGLVGDVESRP